MALPALYAKEPLLNKDWYTEDEYFALEDRSPTAGSSCLMTRRTRKGRAWAASVP